MPSASIYEENNIEKQHLLAETIRLKSILTSLSDMDPEGHQESESKIMGSVSPGSNHMISSTMHNAKFQQQFLRMLKEENEKLKATIRLLENDKILMKARQNTQNTLNNNIKKELENYKNKLILKDS